MRRMTEGSITRHLLAYAIPLILGNIFQLTYNAVDSIIVSKCISEGAMAAVSAANPIMTIVILGVSGISIGASVLMSQFYGAGEKEKLKKELSTTILFGLIVSLIVFVAGLFLSRTILILIKVPKEILDLSEVYLRIIFVGFLFTFQYNIMSAALRSVGDSKTPVIFLAISSVLNCGLDILFICCFKMGVSGAALATVIAEGLSALLCFIYVYKKIPELRINKNQFKIDGKLLKVTIQSGLTAALQQACQPIGKVLIQGVINAQGIACIAAFNAVSRVDDFACIPAQSISHGMMTCTAQNLGADEKKRVRETLVKGLRVEMGYFIIMCSTTLLFKTPIMKIFASAESKEMIVMGVQYLSFMAFVYIFPPLLNGLQGYFRGIGNMRITLISTMIQISLRTLFVFILVPNIGIIGEGYGCLIGWTCQLIFEYTYYFLLRKKGLAEGQKLVNIEK